MGKCAFSKCEKKTRRKSTHKCCESYFIYLIRLKIYLHLPWKRSHSSWISQTISAYFFVASVSDNDKNRFISSYVEEDTVKQIWHFILTWAQKWKSLTHTNTLFCFSSQSFPKWNIILFYLIYSCSMLDDENGTTGTIAENIIENIP